MNKDLEKFKRAYERLCKQFNIEPNEDHRFHEVLSELEIASQERDEKKAKERMQRLQSSKQEYFRKVDPQSRPLRERIFGHNSRSSERPIIEKKRKELEHQFRQIMRDEPNNAVVRYRYGYFHMEEMNFSRAIRFLEEALRIHNKSNCTNPLEEAQKVKAHMYIGFCGGQLLKNSLEQLGQIDPDFESFETEGRSMTKALLMVMNEREQYYAIVNGEKRAISLTEYLRYKEVLEEDCLFISEVEGPTFIKLGEWKTKDFRPALSRLMHVIMQEITEDGNVTVERLQELLEGRNTADTIRRKIDQIHEECKPLSDEDDFELFKLDRSNREAAKVKLLTDNYIYVYRETEQFNFISLNIDEEE
ncbi:hypothetical protein [Ureibacillus acetophenoni]|uniref:Uncharacterized protein n=1 Tax=Ureibacillus acetophenoni TaxID=614649 RepID=A0A285UHR8_9BACL|nr:hypothetical protein [Ureibacillus acetophenoni]SOC41464.1 hypothetical protein SAMN05877842_11075 [Ureibacillus acetophenoni]